MPPWPVLILLLGILAGLTIFMWQSLVRMYAKAQIAIQETMTEVPEAEPVATSRQGPDRRRGETRAGSIHRTGERQGREDAAWKGTQ